MYFSIIILIIFIVVLFGWSTKQLINQKELTMAVCMISIFLSLMVYNVHNFRDLLGTPTTRLPEKEFLLLKYSIKKPYIYLWGYSQGKEKPKAYQIPYSKGAARNLQKGKRNRLRFGFIDKNKNLTVRELKVKKKSK
tara:strand:- start:3038 stop:3448 length:411 start_codon:yes stop_codon:yes gene_type:complete